MTARWSVGRKRRGKDFQHLSGITLGPGSQLSVPLVPKQKGRPRLTFALQPTLKPRLFFSNVASDQPTLSNE